VRPVGILYEHPEWFKLLFAELERREVPFQPLQVDAHDFDPALRESPYSLIVNRVSPSSYLRDHAASILYTRQVLAYLRDLGVPVVNGYDAFTLETSKALQLLLLERLGLPYPRARVVNHPSRLLSAAEGLTYPVIVKPNVGGSGALMRRFESPDELAAGAEGLDLGIDRTAIVQEYLAPAGGAIVRVEVLDGRLLYAIKIQTDPEASFNLCPADICQIEPATTGSEPSAAEGAACDFGAGAVSTPSGRGAAAQRPPGRRPLQIEPFHPPPEIVEQAIAIVRAGGLDVGGVEYLVAERDGRHYFYDVNALSNFVTDAPSMLGFDPTARFVDYLLVRARAGAAVGVAV
jgi:glutathione synthase/RimK-type ligase-like ATP-grasp enzyme